MVEESEIVSRLPLFYEAHRLQCDNDPYGAGEEGRPLVNFHRFLLHKSDLEKAGTLTVVMRQSELYHLEETTHH